MFRKFSATGIIYIAVSCIFIIGTIIGIISVFKVHGKAVRTYKCTFVNKEEEGRITKLGHSYIMVRNEDIDIIKK
jgi:hypothetical protein